MLRCYHRLVPYIVSLSIIHVESFWILGSLGWLIGDTGGSIMPAILEAPRVVEDALDQFADWFANEPQRRHFAEYLTGLMVAANKTVSGIQAEFADTSGQSCLNRFLTAVDGDAQALNARGLGSTS
jgi:hypothetical protein